MLVFLTALAADARAQGCNNTCSSAQNGECEDGGSGIGSSTCAFGTDCADCGPRLGSPGETGVVDPELLTPDSVQRQGTAASVNAGSNGARPPTEVDRSRLGQLGVQMHESDSGVQIFHVVAGSPAEEYDLRLDDVIIALDGQPMASIQEVVTYLQARQPGTWVDLDLVRDGAHQVRRVRLTDAASVDELRRADFVGNWGIAVRASAFTILHRAPTDDEVAEFGSRLGEIHLVIQPNNSGQLLFPGTDDNALSWSRTDDRNVLNVYTAALGQLYIAGREEPHFRGLLSVHDANAELLFLMKRLP